ncbi:hypothetical protein EVAR_34151_1 [Eumeta japonica]|uniref:Uncharacterized protein n=1 Tax=Eumeta variegata TaxID=151549 RepID=A0A4C1ZYS8_EUMVA|nr:hypothetical protein EVAR_34151_1 [Eumeta japonica]
MIAYAAFSQLGTSLNNNSLQIPSSNLPPSEIQHSEEHVPLIPVAFETPGPRVSEARPSIRDSGERRRDKGTSLALHFGWFEGELAEAVLIKFDDPTIGTKIKDHDDCIVICPASITLQAQRDIVISSEECYQLF